MLPSSEPEVDVPKLNKPRLEAQPDETSARQLLIAHEIDPSEVKEVLHFSDGSMSIVVRRGEDIWHHGFEFDAALTADLALAFKALGVRVERSSG
jgi:hypothetical protein